ncbi:MAG: hypothetical protein J6A83_09780 [Clostridia bacterium]|nr:hypothetical protein [Clostridia bacterium]MBP3369341.1 hypothetical protein [Clostridia bacterium]
MKKRIVLFTALVLVAVMLAAVIVAVGAESEKPEMSIDYCALSFQSTVCIKYAVASNVEDINLLIWNEPQSEYTVGTQDETLTTVGSQTIDGKNYIVFDYDGLAAKQMTDDVYAVAYTRAGGVDYYSKVNKYSILQYAYEMFDIVSESSSDSDKALKAMLEDMLVYGSSAQTYFKYKTDRLATADFYRVKVIGGELSDGCAHGLYLANEVLTLTAYEFNADGVPFSHWENDAGEMLSRSRSYEITVGRKNATYTAVYSSNLGIDGYSLVYSENMSESMKLCINGFYSDIAPLSSGVSLSEGADIPSSDYIYICGADEFLEKYGYSLAINDYRILPLDNGGVAIGAGSTNALRIALSVFSDKLGERAYLDGFVGEAYVYTDERTVEDILEVYFDENGRVMSMGHRADLQNYPENSLAAIQSCIDAGVDIIELDVRRTKDGKYVLMHDETVDRTTNGKGKVSELTLAEIQALYLKEGSGGTNAALTAYYPPSFEEALALCSGKIMINLDKDPNNFTSTDIDYFNEVYALLEKYDCVKSTQYKSSAAIDVIKPKFDALEAAGKELPLFSSYMDGYTYQGIVNKIDSFEGFTDMIEFGGFIQHQTKEELAALSEYARSKGMRMMVLSVYGTDDAVDWTEGIALGYSCFMTDHALDLAQYIRSTENERAANDIIRASDFSKQSGIMLKDGSGYDSIVSGRVLDAVSDGDSVCISNISFTGRESSVYLLAKPNSACSVKIYLDVAISDNLIANISFDGEGEDFEYYSSPLLKSLSGKHNLILFFEGSDDYMLNVDLLTFFEGDDTPSTVLNPYIKCLKTDVRLPETVTLLGEQGNPIEKAVVWNSTGNYSVGTHTVVGTTFDGEAVTMLLEVVDCTVISTPAEWNEFARTVNAGDSYSGKVVSLAANINFANSSFVVAGTQANPFEGRFVGGGYTLSNINYSGSGYAGLFGYVRFAEFYDVKLSDCSFATTSNYIGALFAYGDGVKVADCSVSGSNITTTSNTTNGGRGGFVGFVQDYAGVETHISNCTVNGTTVTSHRDVGGFIGDLKSGAIVNCRVTDSAINATSNSSAGFGGNIHGGKVIGCYASVSVTHGTLIADGGNVMHIGAFTGYNSGTPTYIDCVYDGTKNDLPAVGTVNTGYNGVITSESVSTGLPAAAPTTLPNGDKIDGLGEISGSALVTDFDSNIHKINKHATKGEFELTSDGAASGSAIHMFANTNNSTSSATNTTPVPPEIGTAVLSQGIDVTGYSGLLFYVDTTGMTGTYSDGYRTYCTVAIPLKFDKTATSSERIEARSLVGNAYYYENGEWITTTHANDNYRMRLPSGFCGYVYIPFSSYSFNRSTDTSDTANMWYEYIGTTGYKYLTGFTIYTSNAKVDENTTAEIIIDDIYIVK